MNRTLQLLGLTAEQVRTSRFLRPRPPQKTPDFTGALTGSRRKQVAAMLAQGFSQKHIALHLGIAQSTVSKYTPRN